MRTRYSKPSEDIAPESLRFSRDDDDLLRRQETLAQILIDNHHPRSACVLCDKPLDEAASFPHRKLTYLFCAHCSHIQTQLEPPAGYPAQQSAGIDFSEVYPRLSPEAYLSRSQRIYAPKLDWALGELAQTGIPSSEALRLHWLELGAGAGHFLHALQLAGAQSIGGVEQNAELVAIANERLENSPVAKHSGSLTSVVTAQKADIYAAFFVLEHLEDANALWTAFSHCSKGSLLLLAVPVFGLATLLEGTTPSHAARSLDGALHTQIYTDQSLNYAIQAAGYEVLAEWLFGQDALDLKRMVLKQLQMGYPPELLAMVEQRLSKLQDPLQAAVDRCRLSDSRHLIAVKRDSQE